jgi:hypothetical protein
LADRRLLQDVFRAQARQRRLSLRRDRARMVKRRLRIAAVEADEDLSGVDLLIVADQDLPR